MDIDKARAAQDEAINSLGLYRFKITEDGNCLFRAVAAQLQLNQDKYHEPLRLATEKWMRKHAEELLAAGLMENLSEIADTGRVGVWPGQGALVALANVLAINVAVIQGGDNGNVDIQHITPLETPAYYESSGIILAYLMDGHYDAIVHEPDLPNPEYQQWIGNKKERQMNDTYTADLLAQRETTGYDQSKLTPPFKDTFELSNESYNSSEWNIPSDSGQSSSESHDYSTSGKLGNEEQLNLSSSNPRKMTTMSIQLNISSPTNYSSSAGHVMPEAKRKYPENESTPLAVDVKLDLSDRSRGQYTPMTKSQQTAHVKPMSSEEIRGTYSFSDNAENLIHTVLEKSLPATQTFSTATGDSSRKQHSPMVDNPYRQNEANRQSFTIANSSDGNLNVNLSNRPNVAIVPGTRRPNFTVRIQQSGDHRPKVRIIPTNYSPVQSSSRQVHTGIYEYTSPTRETTTTGDIKMATSGGHFDTMESKSIGNYQDTETSSSKPGIIQIQVHHEKQEAKYRATPSSVFGYAPPARDVARSTSQQDVYWQNNKRDVGTVLPIKIQNVPVQSTKESTSDFELGGNNELMMKDPFRSFFSSLDDPFTSLFSSNRDPFLSAFPPHDELVVAQDFDDVKTFLHSFRRRHDTDNWKKLLFRDFNL